jgi:RNA polymerase sigma-70 factor (ECF subfamily)
MQLARVKLVGSLHRQATRERAALVELVSVPDAPDRASESGAVADAIRSLRPEHQSVLLETYYHDRSVAEAAAVLGIPAGIVKSRTFSALRGLKLALEERGLAP